MNQPIYDPINNRNSLTTSPWENKIDTRQVKMFDKTSAKYDKGSKKCK
jgi:hypothetical protein